MNSNNYENVDSSKQPQLKDNHFSCSLKELQAMQLMPFCNQWWIQGRGLGGRAPPPLMFRPKWGPKGQRKNFFWGHPPPYLRVWMTGSPHPSPLIWRPGSTTGNSSVSCAFNLWVSFIHEQWTYNPPWEIGKMRDRPFPLQFNIINF